MEITSKNINLKSLDKKSWQSFRFDQIAKNISERVEPTNTDLEIYVGLEHIEPEDIHIRKFGQRNDVNGTKLRCYPGDIIFGRRRAYQRKAAIVNFDGFCSAHSLVLRAKPEVIDPRLFPFFMHSDQFMHRAVDISVGSLSPTINWGTLKAEKFLLPPKDQQARLAELLWALDEVIEREREVFLFNEIFSKSFIYDFFHRIKSEPKIKLGDICTPKQWKTIPIKDLKDQGHLVYGGNGIIGKYNKYTHEESVIAIACRGENCGNVHFTKPKSYVTGNSMCLDNLKTSVVETKYLYYVLYYSNLDTMISGSAQPQITKSDVERFKIALIPVNFQVEITRKMDNFWQINENVESKIATSKALQKSLINQIF